MHLPFNKFYLPIVVDNASDLLKTLNSNAETPYLIWDNATRAELNEFLTDQQQQIIRTV